MAGYAKPTDSYEKYETSLQYVYIDRVLFDGMYFDKSISMELLGNGIVVMRNCTTTPTPNENTQSLLCGVNLHVRMNNCQVQNQTAIGVRGDNSSAYVTNSTFINSGIGVGGKAAWIENCILQDGTGLPYSDIVVVKKCVIHSIATTDSSTDSKTFLVDNKYIKNSTAGMGVLVAGNGTKNSPASIYIYANNSNLGVVAVDVGNINIFDAEIHKLSMRHQRFKLNLSQLNLSNVKIKSGKWAYADVLQGKWHNVQIYPPVDLEKAKIGKIIGYHVEYPQGTPWVNGSLQITPSSKPLQFDRPKVPTLEETGLAEFWRKNDFPVENY
jgi:hypothetical protein